MSIPDNFTKTYWKNFIIATHEEIVKVNKIGMQPTLLQVLFINNLDKDISYLANNTENGPVYYPRDYNHFIPASIKLPGENAELWRSETR